MTFDQLKEKARDLPLAPGVYIMRDRSNKVIYVGKAKKLKNRVSQYFQDTASHSAKTRQMVSKIDHFDVIVAASEFEALVLECSLIKQYLPKYNILLKDGKGYPYIRLNMKEKYPSISMVSKISDDGAQYFGPFGSRGLTNSIMEALRTTFKLPGCSKVFPRDIGKERPCLNYHMNMCDGWCQANCDASRYIHIMEQVRQLLLGNYKSVTAQIKEQMFAESEAMNFELAASLRDRLRAVEALGQKQLVTAGTLADTDVIGYGENGTNACFAVLHFSGGNLLDKEYSLISVPDDRMAAVSALIKQYYINRGFAPGRILLPFDVEDRELFSQLLLREFGKKIRLFIPQRGDNLQLVSLANKNALDEAQRATGREERILSAVTMLERMVSVNPIKRVESYDISNISGSDNVASMVVFQNGRPAKSEYKRFKIEGLSGPDDYASMRHVLSRRFSRYLSKDEGFSELPDLLLIDGGVEHAKVALSVTGELGIKVPVFGMVKDNRHRTRALVTPDGHQIAIDANPAVFSLIGNIQEETHRFAIAYHRKLRSKRLRYSELDGISGIGPKRKQELLKTFGSISGIRGAELFELERILPKDAAMAVYRYFHLEKE